MSRIVLRNRRTVDGEWGDGQTSTSKHGNPRQEETEPLQETIPLVSPPKDVSEEQRWITSVLYRNVREDNRVSELLHRWTLRFFSNKGMKMIKVPSFQDERISRVEEVWEGNHHSQFNSSREPEDPQLNSHSEKWIVYLSLPRISREKGGRKGNLLHNLPWSKCYLCSIIHFIEPSTFRPPHPLGVYPF